MIPTMHRVASLFAKAFKRLNISIVSIARFIGERYWPARYLTTNYSASCPLT